MATIRKRTLASRTVVWQVDYRDLKNKRRHKQFPTRRKADEWLVNARAEIAAGTHVAANDSPTFEEAAKAWLKECRATLVRSTVDVYEQRFRDYSQPSWGTRKLGELSVADANLFYDDVLDRSRSVETVRRVRIETGAVLSFAQSRGWVVKNVVKLAPFRFRKRRKKRPPMPTIEEVRALIKSTSDAWPTFTPMLFVLIFCGLRSSEIRALRWNDIDFKKGIISVARRADKWGNIDTPKSDAGLRDIVFAKAVADVLKPWRSRCPRSADGLVFPSSVGTVQGHSNLMTRWLRPAQLAAEISKRQTGTARDGKKRTPKLIAKFGMHALRHFTASIWIEADFSPKRVQTMMGHASIKMTFDIYGYLFDARMDVAKATERTEKLVLTV